MIHCGSLAIFWLYNFNWFQKDFARAYIKDKFTTEFVFTYTVSASLIAALNSNLINSLISYYWFKLIKNLWEGLYVLIELIPLKWIFLDVTLSTKQRGTFAFTARYFCNIEEHLVHL